jgi:hypothetical protein
VDPDDAGQRVEPRRLLERGRRGLLLAARLLGEPELHQGSRLPRREPVQRGEFLDRRVELRQGGVRAPELEPGVGVVRLAPQPLAQLGDRAIVEAGLLLHQLQVSWATVMRGSSSSARANEATASGKRPRS